MIGHVLLWAIVILLSVLGVVVFVLLIASLAGALLDLEGGE